ncbi:MAG: HAD family phosphatase [Phycisphaerales bacterium]|nr:HAD family phosphatase [Phycisphaerales bacterium]
MPQRPIAAVIFDLDGTLANSELAHEEALRAAAASRGMTLSAENFQHRFVGLGESACFRILAQEQGIDLTPALLEELLATKLDHFLALAGRGAVTPWPGAVELVAAASAAGRVALCTGSGRVSVAAILRAIGLADAFGVVVTSDDVARTKPDPEGYRLAAARLGVDPGASIAIEDSPTGVRAARAAGLQVFAVEHSFPASSLGEAHRIFRTLAEIGPELVQTR